MKSMLGLICAAMAAVAANGAADVSTNRTARAEAAYRRFIMSDAATRRALVTNLAFRADAASGKMPPPGAYPFQPRWGKGISNLRDLGGWRTADGRRIRCGRLFRSAGFDKLDADNLKALKRLGIRTELDLRDPATTPSRTVPGVKLVTLGKSAPAYAGAFSEKGRRLVRQMFEILLDEQNHPVVFHCAKGADRTGTLAALVEFVLGVPEDDVSRDWQLTVFCNPNPKFQDERYDRFLAALSAYPGADWRAKTEAFLRECGITDAQLSAFRELMLERPRFTFGFVSDTHVTGASSRARGKGRANTGLDAAFAWFAGFGVDAVVNAGDVTEGGTREEVELYRAAFERAFPGGKTAHFSVWGNHDVLDASYMRKSGPTEPPANCVPGNHRAFRTLLDGEAAPLGESVARQLGGVWFVGADWNTVVATNLIVETAAKAASNVFFYVQHAPGSSRALGGVLAPYPNCVQLSGHSHTPLDAPHAVRVGGRRRVELAGGSTDAYAAIVQVWADGVTVVRRDLRKGRELTDLSFAPVR